jgi:hypothetical protein
MNYALIVLAIGPELQNALETSSRNLNTLL